MIPRSYRVTRTVLAVLVLLVFAGAVAVAASSGWGDHLRHAVVEQLKH